MYVNMYIFLLIILQKHIYFTREKQ